MKKIFFLFLIAIPFLGQAQTVTALASTNGIAPVPAFGLGKPAGLVFINTNISKHVEFSPDFTFSLKDGKPWFMDLWLRWNQPLDSAGKWIATVGIDPVSTFYQPFYIGYGKKDVTQSVRYPTYQLKFKFIPDSNNTVTLDYWYTFPTEKEYGVEGSYISLAYSLTKRFNIFKEKCSFTTNPNFFYLTYSDKTKGFAGSIDGILSHSKSGLFLSNQYLIPLGAKKVKFAWNISLGITRKLF